MNEKSVHIVSSYCICISQCTVQKTVKYNSTLSLISAPNGVDGQRHAPAALPPGKTRHSLYKRLGGPQDRSVRVRTISPPNVFRTSDSPARSESLYWLRYLCPSKGRGLIYCFSPQIGGGHGADGVIMFCDFLFLFVCYDITTCVCSVSGP